MSLSTWKNTARQDMNQKKKSPKKSFSGGNFFWRDKLALPSTVTKCLFIAAEHLSPGCEEPAIFYKVPRHTITLETAEGKKYFKSFVCSHAFGENCYGCELMYDKRDKRINLKDQYFFSVVVMDWFFKVPAVDADGKAILSKKTGEPVFNVSSPKNPKEKLEWSKRHERQFGKRAYLEIGRGHFSHILSIDDALTANCSCGGEISTLLYSCGSCSTPVIDMTSTELTQKELDQIIQSPHTCNMCHNTDFLEPSILCDSCASDANPVGVTSAIVNLQRQGEGTSSAITMSGFTRLQDFNVPTDNQPAISEDGVFHPDLLVHMAPYPFDQMFKHELSYDYQKALCNE